VKSLTFDADTHTYCYGGQRVPSVTQVIKHAGLVDYSAVPDWMLNFKAELGRAAHSATEMDDEGDLDEASLDPRVLPYVGAYRLFREESGFEMLSSEERIVHSRYKYAGTVDRVVRDGQGHRAILELKTTAAHHERAVALQTVGYYAGWNSQHPAEERARRRYALHLRPDASYRLYRYDDHAGDLAEFLTHLKEFCFD